MFRLFATCGHVATSAVVAFLTFSGTSHASVINVSTRAALNGNDVIDWSVLGPSFSAPPNPFTIESVGGLEATVYRNGGSYQTRKEQGGSSPGDWNGSFAAGDPNLLESDDGSIGNNSPLTITFAEGVSAAGLQFNHDYGTPWDVTFQALDVNGNILNQVSSSGLGTGTGNNNTAGFWGVVSSSANIYEITVLATSLDASPSFAINEVTLFVPPPIPEPSTYILLITAIVALCGWRLTRRKNVAVLHDA